MSVHPGKTKLCIFGADVVDQQPNAHTAISGAQNALGEHLTDGVVLPNIVLQIEGFLGYVGEADSAAEAFSTGSDQRDTRLEGMGLDLRQKKAAQFGGLWTGERSGRCACIVRWQACRTANKKQNRQQARDCS